MFSTSRLVSLLLRIGAVTVLCGLLVLPAYGQWKKSDETLSYEFSLDAAENYFERPSVLIDNNHQEHAANTVLALEDEAGGGARYRGGLIMYGAAPAAGRNRLHLTSNLKSGPQLTLNESGNVGIGTRSPSADLQIRARTQLYESDGRTYLKNEAGGNGLTINVKNVNGLKMKSTKWTKVVWDRGGYGNRLDFIGNGVRFARFSTTNNTIRFHQKVGIGTGDPEERLSVNGNVLAKEVIVKPSRLPDYVFEDSYDLPTLGEVSAFIETEGHLPDVPSAESVEQDGLRLGEMDATLLQKVEELTLYAIEQKERADSLKEQLSAQQRRTRRLEDQAETQDQRIQRLERQVRALRSALEQTGVTVEGPSASSDSLSNED
jgi:hypothetical protein